LQAEIARDLPKIDDQQKADLQKAREGLKSAEAAANAATQPLNKISEAKALVSVRPSTWLSKAASLRGGVTGRVSSGGVAGRRSGWRDGC